MHTIYFEENQRFKELSIYILLGLLQALFLWGLIQQTAFNKPWGTKPAGDFVLIIINLVMLLLILLIFLFNLKTVITEHYISFRFLPLQTKMRIIYWKEVKSIRIIKYDGIEEYWGFGLRFMPGRGWCYTMPGHDGIRLTLSNGKKILIGTHRAKEISGILNDLKTKGIIKTIN